MGKGGMRSGNGVVVVLLLVGLCMAWGAEENLKEECSNDFQRVVSCFDFATEKAEAPSKDCCVSVKEIKESDAKCLCFFIQQTHGGNQQIKNMGVQEAKLLELPSACHLKNASVSYCPQLLGIPANSPDAAIFTNTTTPASPSGTATTRKTSPDGSFGTKMVANSPAGLVAVAVAVMYLTAFIPPIKA